MSQTKESDLSVPLFSNVTAPVITEKGYVYEAQADIVDLMIQMNLALKAGDYPLVIRSMFPKPDEVSFELQVKCGPNEYLLLPEDIANVFGYRRRLFGTGTYVSEYLSSPDSVNILTDRELYPMKLLTFTSQVNLIKLKRRCAEMAVTWFRAKTSFPDFLKFVSDSIKLYDYNFELAVVDNNHISLKFDSDRKDPYEYLKLPVLLMEMFGFTESAIFKPGEYKSNAPYSEDIFKDLVPNEQFMIELNKFQDVLIPMKQPTDKSYESVIRALNESFDEWNFDDSRPIFYLEDGHLYMSPNCEDEIHIQLPPAVCEYFGFPTTEIFIADRGVPVNETIRNEERDKVERQIFPAIASHMPIENDDREILVLLDIIENQIYGECMAPVLQDLQWNLNTDLRKNIDSVLYLPLNCDVVTQIRVTLTDEKLHKLTNLNKYISILKLHFRPRIGCC